MPRRKIYGDVQTPDDLARETCNLLARRGACPATVLEPTCGIGAFLVAAQERFPGSTLLGFDENIEHLRTSATRLPTATLEQRDAFEVDWRALVQALPAPLLLLGNPPWSTTSVQGRSGARNRPAVSEGPGGLDSITGASNFDVSEWLMRRWLEALRPGDQLAMILKRSVIRRLLDWEGGPALESESIAFDARRAFDAAVDAELFLARLGERVHHHSPSFESKPERWQRTLGAWVRAHAPIDETRIGAPGLNARFRSGLKHDCRRLFELEARADGSWASALEDGLVLEASVSFPLLKSTDLARGRPPSRALLVTQRSLEDDPARLASEAPRAWAYLMRHRAEADRRRSRIYLGRPSFAQFGVGAYSFAPHKVAVSGLHWPPRFRAVGPVEGKPVFFDDTCYASNVRSAAEARTLAEWLNHPETLRSLEAFTDPGAKRPVTKRLLSRLRLPDFALGPPSGMGQIRGRDERATGTADSRRDRSHPTSG